MLSKLIKLDYKWINKFFLQFASADLFFALLTFVFRSVDSPFGSFMRHFSSSLTITLFFSLSLNVFARTLVNFKHKLYGDESYLARTLPVTKKSFWASKFLTVAISIVPIALVIGLALLIAEGFNTETLESIKLIFETFRTQVILLAVLVYLEICFINLAIFNGILFGHKKDVNKGLWTAIYIGAFYFGTQILLLGLFYLLSKPYDSFAMLFTSGANFGPEGVSANFNVVIYCSIAYYLLAGGALYLLGQRALESGVDVE